MGKFNHGDGFFGISVVGMTQTLEPETTIERIKIYKTSPELYDAMMALSNAAAKDVDAELGELIKIRASQINHCAFCLDMHTRDARKHGVSDQKLDVLAAWEEAGGLFTERERAALALTEAITELGDGHVPDEVYERASEVFAERELGQVIALAVTINAWNRINVTIRLQPSTR
jgi:AhpD family alkylhydroperoxidase